MVRACWSVWVCLMVGCTLSSESATTDVPASNPVTVTAQNDQEVLLRRDPIAFLEQVLARMEQEVTSYRVLLIKQERLAGKLEGIEQIDCWFQRKPLRVRMDWKQGARLARRTLYVEGEHEGQMLVQPAGWRALAGIVQRDPEGPEARKTARYPITEFGIEAGSRRTLRAWKAARDRGELHFQYMGTKAIPELDDQICWVLQREERAGVDAEGITSSTFYFETTRGLQLGSVLRDAEGQLVGRYYFRNLELHPTFSEEIFTRQGLRR